MPVPGLMDFETWKQEAKKNAAKNGRPWDESTAQNRYAGYVWQMEHPQGDASVLGRAGTGTGEQQQTGSMAAGSFADDSPDAGNAHTGDPYIDELRSGRVAGSEDWRRFSNAQLKSWERFYIGGGQFRNQFGDIVGKPIDRGPNTPPGVNGMGVGGAGGGGGGGGGGYGGGGGGASAAAKVPLTSPLAEMLANQGGITSQYDPTKGDEKPGIRGGIIGGGGIWYQPVQQPAAVTPATTSAPPAAIAPTSVAPAAASTAGAAQPGQMAPVASMQRASQVGWRTPQPQQGQFASPWANRPAWNPTNPLAQAIIPFQGQQAPASPLTDLLSPYQQKRKTMGTWF